MKWQLCLGHGKGEREGEREHLVAEESIIKADADTARVTRVVRRESVDFVRVT